MAGERILIVDDTPVNLKLTRILLVNEGYTVLTAASAEEALEQLQEFQPRLVLADIQLPGMDGLEMTRRIKQNQQTRGIVVIALTAFAMKGDEQRALDAGCEGYITKPIDTRTLGSKIRELLARHPETAAPSAAAQPEHEGIPAAELQSLRRRFLQEGQEKARQILLELDGRFDAQVCARTVHQWVGAGGLLGYPALSRLAREIETLLRERPVDTAQVRESLTSLLLAFNTPREALDEPLPEAIRKALFAKCVAIVGLPAPETQRLCIALERAQARAVFFQLGAAPAPAELAECDLIATYISPAGTPSPWLDPSAPLAALPTLFIGNRDDILALDPALQAMTAGFLIDFWQPDEALVRLAVALTPQTERRPVPAPPSARALRVVVADEDCSVLGEVRSALQEFAIELHLAGTGTKALEAIRGLRPQAAILDVNLPELDGYEVLAALSAESLEVPVMMLIARRQESDVIRGFCLGAGDYLAKPFSPVELVARLQRLIAR